MPEQKKSQPDKMEKFLEDYADVFADIINVLIYKGILEVKAGNLQEEPLATRFRAAEGHIGEKYRDIIKLDMRDNICYAVFGLRTRRIPAT